MALANGIPNGIVMDNEIDLVSPCVSVCTLDPATGYCRGCLRTDAEIAAWPDLSYDDKIEVLDRLRARRQAAGLPVRRATRRRGANRRRPPVA